MDLPNAEASEGGNPKYILLRIQHGLACLVEETWVDLQNLC